MNITDITKDTLGLQSRTISSENILLQRVKEITQGKPVICGGMFISLPLPPRVEEHFRNPNHEYLWMASTITKETMPSMPDEALEKAKGLHIGMWLSDKILHVQYVLVNDLVLNYILALNVSKNPSEGPDDEPNPTTETGA
jgi:hypothetical protein